MTAVRIIAIALAAFVVAIAGIRFVLSWMLSTGGAPAGAIQKVIQSKDGTRIGYEQAGAGPVLILVPAALVDRQGTRPLATQLASSFTVINYNRRGRGMSSNVEPYTVEREIEDIEALVSAAGTPVFLFGSSSGSVLALDAGSRLGAKATGLFLYEPPFIVDNSRPPLAATLNDEIKRSLAANKPDQAVALFFQRGMGIPARGCDVHALIPAGVARHGESRSYGAIRPGDFGRHSIG